MYKRLLVIGGDKSDQNFTFNCAEHLDPILEHSLRALIDLLDGLADQGDLWFTDRVPKNRLQLIVYHLVAQIVQASRRFAPLHEV